MQYGTYLKKWLLFCDKGKVDAPSPSTNSIIGFFNSLYEAGLDYSAIHSVNLAIQTLIVTCAQADVSGTPWLIKTFMKRCI